MSMLRISDLTIRSGRTELVRNVSLEVAAGERVGLIGESGSGKSLTSLATMGLLDEGLAAHGEIHLEDTDRNLLATEEKHLAKLRGKRLGMVFQEPLTALNPVMRVGDQIAEVFRIHKTCSDRRSAKAAAIELLEKVRLPDPAGTARAYPHQLSGGQRQRVVIAIAIANDPAVLICDEPTSALDVTVQAQVLELIENVTAASDTGLLFITHDLPVVSQICQRALVMRDGEIVESGPIPDIFRAPNHPYTKALVEASELGESRVSSSPSTADDAGEDGGQDHPIIEVRNLSRHYRRPRTSLASRPPSIRALTDVDLEIRAGQRFGIVGESGSGKSTLIRLMAGLDHPTSGTIYFDGTEIGARPERSLRFLREDLQMVFQDPTGSLDPRMRVRDIVSEPLIAQGHPNARSRVDELLEAVGLPEDAAGRYPHQFSGGQRQRISIARALAPRPKVLIADEPVSALDAPIRAQILDLLDSLVESFDLSLIFVSHDLAVVRHLCDTVAVLNGGKIVETGTTESVYTNPQESYTKVLLEAIPSMPVDD